MTKGSNDIPALILSLLLTLGLLGAGYWLFGRKFLSPSTSSSPTPVATQPNPGQPTSSPLGSTPPTQSNAGVTSGTAQLDTSLPDPDILAIDGSVTMVAMMKRLQNAFSLTNPALPTTYGVPDGRPNGTNAGLQNLMNNVIWVAASSRPLSATELQANLKGVPIARDAIAIVVGTKNPFSGGLTLEQLRQIYQGQITNWSQVGGPDLPIKVINRSPDSGTYSLFQDVVLVGGAFAPDSANFVTLSRDETTPMLQMLGNNGIGYSTVSQVENQQTVRVVPINGVSPSDREAIKNGTYPISRVVYLAVRQPTSPGAKQFIDLTLSPQGQQIVQDSGFIPLF
jgi:phosphate transport system substrate-binding protein